VKNRHGRATVSSLYSVAASQSFLHDTGPCARDASSRRSLIVSNPAITSPSQPVSIPVGELLPWAILAGLISILALYFVGAEQGATSIFSGMYVHEFVHDGRHLLGFPCH
jgi:hypothetical protein